MWGWDGSQSFATFSQGDPTVEDRSLSILSIPYIQVRVQVQVGMGERFGSEKVEPGDEEAEVGVGCEEESPKGGVDQEWREDILEDGSRLI